MPTFPNRCQHIKVNGTQCGCPALRRNQLCYFHKRHHDERVQLNLDRLKEARRRPTTIDLPVLEDADSIQISLMQIMRLILTGEIDAKTAGLLLYALQTASSNLARTTFEPDHHDVILSPAQASETRLDEPVWEDEDFEEEEEKEEVSEADRVKEAGIRKAAEFLYSLDVKRDARLQAAKAGAATQTSATQPPRANARRKDLFRGESRDRSQTQCHPRHHPVLRPHPARPRPPKRPQKTNQQPNPRSLSRPRPSNQRRRQHRLKVMRQRNRLVLPDRQPVSQRQPRSGERMQPTAQAVGRTARKSTSPGGAKEPDAAQERAPESESKAEQEDLIRRIAAA